eukprot:5717416-Pyramimonas_sp.AAC.1
MGAFSEPMFSVAPPRVLMLCDVVPRPDLSTPQHDTFRFGINAGRKQILSKHNDGHRPCTLTHTRALYISPNIRSSTLA